MRTQIFNYCKTSIKSPSNYAKVLDIKSFFTRLLTAHVRINTTAVILSPSDYSSFPLVVKRDSNRKTRMYQKLCWLTFVSTSILSCKDYFQLGSRFVCLYHDEEGNRKSEPVFGFPEQPICKKTKIQNILKVWLTTIRFHQLFQTFLFWFILSHLITIA